MTKKENPHKVETDRNKMAKDRKTILWTPNKNKWKKRKFNRCRASKEFEENAKNHLNKMIKSKKTTKPFFRKR